MKSRQAAGGPVCFSAIAGSAGASGPERREADDPAGLAGRRGRRAGVRGPAARRRGRAPWRARNPDRRSASPRFSPSGVGGEGRAQISRCARRLAGSGAARRAGSLGSAPAAGSPSSARTSGRRKSTAQTVAEVGLPGRPSTLIAPRRPWISGLPGRMAMRQKSSDMPASASAWRIEVVIADRGAADRRQHVGPGAPRLGETVGERGGIVGARRRDRAARRPPRRRRRRRRRRWRRRSAPARAPAPGATSSSPLDRMATRGRRRTGKRRMIGGGGERDVARGQPSAGATAGSRLRRNRGRAGGRGRPARSARPKVTASPSRCGDLLHRHRVGALGQRRAGEDARRLAAA